MGHGKGQWGTHMGDTNHVPPKVSHVHVEQYHGCRTCEDFWAGLGWKFAELGQIRWWLHVWEADIRWSTAAGGGEHCPECMRVICMGFFGAWGCLYGWRLRLTGFSHDRCILNLFLSQMAIRHELVLRVHRGYDGWMCISRVVMRGLCWLRTRGW